VRQIAQRLLLVGERERDPEPRPFLHDGHAVLPPAARLTSQSIIVVAVSALLLAPAAAAGIGGLPIRFVPASPANYHRTHRPASAIRLVVVHVTEGTVKSAISWFRNPRARASANYLVSRDGAITQMVPDASIAWHAGNPWVNHHSLGVENEGYVGVNGTITDTEYRWSARLVAALLRRYVLPIDRKHVIGHNEVPDPFRPWLRGGFAHHTDPGRYWDWKRYLGYVRSYARGVVPAPPALDVSTEGIEFGQTVAGTATLDVVPSAPVDHVDFLVDGKLRETQTTLPFALTLDTTLEPNGRHVVIARAVDAQGRSATSAVVFGIANPVVKIRAVTVANGRWEAAITGAPARVEFVVDGVVRATLLQRPYAVDFNEPPGPHILVVRAFRSDGKLLGTRTITVVVPEPAP
jgi:hypothetical protein